MDQPPAPSALSPSAPLPAAGQPPAAPDQSTGTKPAAKSHRLGAWLLRLVILVIAGSIVALFAIWYGV